MGTSWVLVSRLERVGARFGLSEALLGLVAALAADAPEITAAVASLLQHEQTIGAGVVLGSNVFNLAALLGLGAVVAGGSPCTATLCSSAGPLPSSWPRSAC